MQTDYFFICLVFWLFTMSLQLLHVSMSFHIAYFTVFGGLLATGWKLWFLLIVLSSPCHLGVTVIPGA